eukprot:6030111-Pleurochrysis_carterae.AAC.4
MAGKLAAYEDRTDVTALPVTAATRANRRDSLHLPGCDFVCAYAQYGVNTPAGFLSSYSIMLPLAFKYAGTPYGLRQLIKFCSAAIHKFELVSERVESLRSLNLPAML